MLEIRQVDDLGIDELQPYRTLKRQEIHREKGIFVAEGAKVVQRLIESGLPIVSVLIAPEWVDSICASLSSREEKIVVFCATQDLLEKLVGFQFFKGVLAVGIIPPEPSLDQLLSQGPEPALFVALDGITNSENMGVIVRNCAALHATALLIGETCCSPYLRRAIRNSMGNAFVLPLHHCSELRSTLERLQTGGIQCLAAHPDRTNAKPLFQADLKVPTCLVFGHEGDGISSRILKQCNSPWMIPMKSDVDSLNVANAVALFLYEAQRQRHLG